MTQGDQPERARPHGLPGREVAVEGEARLRATLEGRAPVRKLPLSFRSMADNLHQREANDEHQQAGDHRGGAPAKRLQRPDDHGHREPTQGEPELRYRNGFGPVTIEPVDDGDHQRRETAQARAQRDEGEGQIEGEQGLHLAEQDEPGTEEHRADGEDRAGPESVHQPALERSEDAALYPGQRKRPRDHGFAPTEVLLKEHHVRPVRLHPQHGGQPLDTAAGQHDPPAIENLSLRPHDAVKFLPDACHGER